MYRKDRGILMKILIFGAGKWGHVLLNYLKEISKDEILGFVDNHIDNDADIVVYNARDLARIDFDKIIIAVKSTDSANEIKKQLCQLQVPKSKIISILDDNDLFVNVFSHRKNAYDEFDDSRVGWLRHFSNYVKNEKIQGNVAECGVYMGDFAVYINKYFSDRKLYLFDTFEGFPEKDLAVERLQNKDKFLLSEFNSKEMFFANNEEIVRRKMPYPDQVEIHKGYFPETAQDINDNFVFVNLDMDLYQPMFAGLEYFYPQMSTGGVLLLHDYFREDLPGVKKAVNDYERNHNIHLAKIPIGDECSLAIVKV